MTAPVILVLARAANGVIGANGTLPWPRLEGDLPRFKQITMGKPCIMGRKTWESLPKKPLAGRTNIVVTRNRFYAAEGALVAGNIEKALRRADEEMPEAIMVIGGAEIFAAALPFADKIELTEIFSSPEGEVVMPPFPPGKWQEVLRESPAPTHAYVTLQRRGI